MISDRWSPILIAGIFLLVSLDTFANSSPRFSEFVITPSKFQRILWRDFLIEFPNIYSKANHRTYETGTTVFSHGGQVPILFFQSTQGTEALKDGSVRRITRLNLHSPSGGKILDLIVRDTGETLETIPTRELMSGRLPLDLDESGLREKHISVSGEKIGAMEMTFLIASGRIGEEEVRLHVASGGRNQFGIREIQKRDRREVTWFLWEDAFKEHRTLKVEKLKTDWMLFGSEEFSVDSREITPAEFQERFYAVERFIVKRRDQLKEAVEKAIKK